MADNNMTLCDAEAEMICEWANEWAFKHKCPWDTWKCNCEDKDQIDVFMWVLSKLEKKKI